MLQSRQLAAIIFTDIVGYTALMGRDEQKAFQLLKINTEIQKPTDHEVEMYWLKVASLFISLRNDKRFQDIVKQNQLSKIIIYSYPVN